jgi:hypothetical protein
VSENNALYLHLSGHTKIDKQSQSQVCALQIVQKLGAMLAGKGRYGLQFNDNLFKAYKIRPVAVPEITSLAWFERFVS